MLIRSPVLPAHRLGDPENAVWGNLEREFAPLVIGDSIGDAGVSPLPPLADVGWCSLYGLGIYLLSAFSGSDVYGTDRDQPRNNALIQWDDLVRSFWAGRNAQLEKFRRFLAEWHLSRELRAPISSRGLRFYYEPESDEKILGLHLFHSSEEVNEYVLRWLGNPDIRNVVLKQHRLLLSRGIDLICSELIANGFEHGSRPVFILAKLCSPKSALRALELNRSAAYLTPSELQYYTRAAKEKFPILQFVIADAGRGFGANPTLIEHYRGAGLPSAKDVLDPEVELIEYALTGAVTTKTDVAIAEEWLRLAADPDGVRPVVHGLYEVEHYVSNAHGYWRIHSNNSALELDFSGWVLPSRSSMQRIKAMAPNVASALEELANDPRAKVTNASIRRLVSNLGTSEQMPLILREISRSRRPARPIPGCLHYFMFPLVAEDYVSPRLTASHSFNPTRFRVVDSAEYIYNDESDGSMTLPRAVGQFCRQVRNLGSEGIPALINLSAFDTLSDTDLRSACALLADTLHRLRGQIPVLIAGAFDTVQSQLLRFAHVRNFFLEWRVLAFVDLYGGASRYNITLFCAETLGHIKGKLESALSESHLQEICRSAEGTDWKLFCQVALHNQGLFSIVSVASDEFFQGRIRVPTGDRAADALLLGGRLFSELSIRLKAHRAVAPHAKNALSGYLRRGLRLNDYLHLGRLMADSAFAEGALGWLSVAIQNLPGIREYLRHHGRGVVILGLLHPAIDLAQSLLSLPPLEEAEIVEVRRLGDLAWDADPIISLAGRNVIIIIDLIRTGETLNRAIESLTEVEANIMGAVTILTVGDYTTRIPLYSYSFCEAAELESLSKSVGANTKMRIVDADSQFTLPAPKVNARGKPSALLRLLLESGCLCFGHRVFGAQHDTFVVLLRRMSGRALAALKAKIQSNLRSAFGRSKVDLVLIPGDSTASYVAFKVAKALGGDVPIPVVIATPAFRGYGSYDLILEFSQSQESLLKGRSLHALFLDDSISSGRTEAYTINALLSEVARIRDTGHHPKPLQVNWLTFAVLRRGDRPADDYLPTRARPAASLTSKPDVVAAEFHYKFAFAGAIGPESLDQATCPLCPASHALHYCQRWVAGARRDVADLINKAAALFTARPLEQIASGGFIADHRATSQLLYLSNLEMPSACVQIRQMLSRNREWLPAALLFVSLHFRDVSSYLGTAEICNLLLRVTSLVQHEDSPAAEVFLLSAFALPLSFLLPVTFQLLEMLVRNDCLNLATALIATTFSRHYLVLDDAAGSAGTWINAEFITRRQQALRVRILENIDTLATSGMANAAHLLRADANAISTPPNLENAVWVARTLSALLYKGNHASFLSAELEMMASHTVAKVQTNVAQVMRWFAKLSELTSLGLESRIAEISEMLRKLSESDVEEFRRMAQESIGYLWHTSAISLLFQTPKLLGNLLAQARDNVYQRICIASYPRGLYSVAPVDSSVEQWSMFGPPASSLVHHFQNLLENPIRHFSGVKCTWSQADLDAQFSRAEFATGQPLAVIYMKVDAMAQRLLLVFADRAAPLDQTKLFTWSGGLANARAQLQLHGGDVEYRFVDNGIQDPMLGPAATMDDSLGVDGRNYKNIFVTSLPLMLETRL